MEKEIDDTNVEISKLKEEGVDESKVISLQKDRYHLARNIQK